MWRCYTGKVDNDPNLRDVGLRENIVLRLTTIVPRNAFHKICFYNWFTSVQLHLELEKLGIQCLGTVCSYRLYGCKFSSYEEMKKGKGLF
jgi:hypothetical protein